MLSGLKDLMHMKEKYPKDIFIQFFENSIDLQCIADTKGFFRKLNKEWESTLGYPVSELEGKRFIEFVHPDDVEKTIAATKHLANNNKIQNFVNRYRHQNGTYRWIEWRSFPVKELVYASARDITERINIEHALKESEERNSLINSLTTDYIFKFTVNEKNELSLIYTSENFTEITGRTLEESQQIKNWKYIFHPEDYPKVMMFVQQMLTNGKPGEMECRSNVRGKIRWITIVAKPEIEKTTGRVISITGAVKDITDRKLVEIQLKFSEEMFSKSFQSIPDSVLIYNCLTGIIININEAFIKTSGYLRHEVIGKTADELNLWVDLQKRDLIIDLLNNNKKVLDQETSLRMRSGDIRNCVITGENIEINREKCQLLFIHDITDLKKAEKEINFNELKFRSIFENSTVGIVLLGLDGTYLMVNQAICNILGYGC